MEYKVVRSSNADRLTEKVNQYIAEGFKPIGSHQAVVKHEQNRFRGTQHADTINELEYTQTIIRES